MFKKITKKLKNEPIIFLFRKMWHFSAGNRKDVILYIILFIFSNIIKLLPPLVFASFINEIQKNGIIENNINFLILLLVSLIILMIIFWIFYGPARIIERNNAFIVKKQYKTFLQKGVLNNSLTWHSKKDSGDTIDKINKASNNLFEFSEMMFVTEEIIVKTVGTIIAIAFFNIYIAIGIIIFLFLPFKIMNIFDKKLTPQYDRLNKYDNKISAKIFDSLTNITSVIILNIKEIVLKNIVKTLEKPKKLYIENSKLNEWKWSFIGTSVEIFVVVPLIFYIIYIYSNVGFVEIGSITALYMYLRNISDVFYNFGWQYAAIIRNKVAVDNAKDIEESFSKQNKKKKKEIKNWKSLKIKNLNFKYADAEKKEKDNLRNINLEIEKGEKIAFIGQSGSGKTTFLKVIHGLYENAKAEISFNDEKDSTMPSATKNAMRTNFTDIDLKTMLVPQEPELFSSSIRENVTFGLDYNDKEVKKVLKLAEFTKVLKELPKGLDSIVNEKGVNLSGGQKQRLALARALLFSEEKEIILLDESTSSVDSQTEVEIYKNIFSKFSGKTFLASIHKMNLLKYFDKIIIFKQGEISDSGTFQELLERNEEFKEQWEEYVKLK